MAFRQIGERGRDKGRDGAKDTVDICCSSMTVALPPPPPPPPRPNSDDEGDFFEVAPYSCL